MSAASGSAAVWNSTDATATCGANTIRSFSFSTKLLHFPPVTARASNAAEKTQKLLLRYGPTTLLPIAVHTQWKWIYLCNPSALDGRLKRKHPLRIAELPDGTMIEI